MAAIEPRPTNPSEVMRAKLFDLQRLLCVGISTGKRDIEKIQQAQREAMRYCETQISESLDGVDRLDPLPLWKKIHSYLEILDLNHPHRPAWRMEDECDQLQRMYGPNLEEALSEVIRKRLGWAEEHSWVSGEMIDYALELMMWKDKAESFPIVHRGLDHKKTDLVLQEMTDLFDDDIDKVPMKRSEMLSIDKKLNAAHEKRIANWRGGRLSYCTLEESLVATTALRIAASEEKLVEAAETSRAWGNGSNGFFEEADVVAVCLSRDLETLKSTLEVLSRTTKIIEDFIKMAPAH
jgi:hypothetical protein